MSCTRKLTMKRHRKIFLKKGEREREKERGGEMIKRKGYYGVIYKSEYRYVTVDLIDISRCSFRCR